MDTEEEPMAGTSQEEERPKAKRKRVKKTPKKEPKPKPPALSVEGGAIRVRPHKPPKAKTPVKKKKTSDDDSDYVPEEENDHEEHEETTRPATPPPPATTTSATSNVVVEQAKVSSGMDPADIFAEEKQYLQTWRTAKNVFAVVLEEIALEGLDGITLEALWKRLSSALVQPLPFSQSFERQIWESVRSNENVDFYALPKGRRKMEPVRWQQHIPSEVIYGSDDEEDMYPFKTINDKENGVIGSCADYETRVCINADVRVADLKTATEKYENKLVLVANQKQREFYLLPETTNPLLLNQMNEIHYGLLERIGRSRRIGELTCGPHSLVTIFKDSKTLFYYRKVLINNQLITKQPFFLMRVNNQNTTGNLFHLQRFYNERKSRRQSIIEHIVKFLKSRPKHRMEYLELRTLIGAENWEKLGLTKLVKSNEFKQYVRTDVTVPYREIYPNATVSEWRRKAMNREKIVRIFELINPNVNISFITKDDDQKDSSSDDEAQDHFSLNTPIGKQAYEVIYKKGPQGVFLKELKRLLGMDFYSIRGTLKTMMRSGLVYSSMVDVGRQRYSKFFATCFKGKSADDLPARVIAPYPEDDHADETLDFIASVLKIDAHHLKGKRDEEPPPSLPDNHLKGRYDEIREIRVSNRVLDETEKFRVRFAEDATENTVRTERKKLLQDIYANRHEFVDYHKSLEEGIITRPRYLKDITEATNRQNIGETVKEIAKASTDENDANGTLKSDATRNENGQGKSKEEASEIAESTVESANCVVDTFKRIINGCFEPPPRNHQMLFVNKTLNESSIDAVQEGKFAKSLGVIKTRTIRKFRRYLDKLYVKPPNCMSKNYKTYLLQHRVTFQALASGDFPQLLSSDDEEEKEECDAASLYVNFESGECASLNEPIAREVKDVLIEACVSGGCLLEKFGESAGELVELKRKRVEEDDSHAKRSKRNEKEKTIDELFKLEMYMGPKPITLSDTVDEDGIQTKVIVSSEPGDFENIKTMTLSERVEKRCKLVREAIAKHRIIPDITKLLQMFLASEKKEGYTVTVDRKSLFRIYRKLVREGTIKMVKILVKYENIVRSKTIMVSPNVDIQTFINSAIEQFKMSFFIYAKRKVVKAEIEESKVPTIREERSVDVVVEARTQAEKSLDAETTANKVRYRYSRTVGKGYGYYPKIAKMRVLHEFLYYLLYAYEGKPIASEEVPDILSRHCESDAVLVKECSTLYQREASWKMFIPPVPVHKTWTDGWLLISDALLRLPISIFVKVFNVNYIIPELPKYYLNHPIRKHFLVKNLPPDTRDAILSYRKYIFSIYEIFCYLCYLGLLQFGPQKFREKDQQFVYLNKRAILYDTSSSGPGYHQITPSEEYEKLEYAFDTQADIEKYWGDMYGVCMRTKLGQRSSVLGTYISLESVHGKHAMIESLKHQTPESVLVNDVGYLPGDGLGACRADSALWLHVKRNWNWSAQASGQSSLSSSHTLSGIRKKYIEDIKPMKFMDYLRNSMKKTGKGRGGGEKCKRLGRKKIIKPSRMNSKKKAILRKVKPRKPMPKRVQVDLIDKGILDKMGKSRSTFCDEEDNLIHLCKAVCDFLCSNYRKRAVVNSTLRDFIHRILPYSRKTSKAYKRRYMQIKKSENLQDDQKQFVFNLNSDYFTQTHFKKQKDKLDSVVTVSEAEISLTFLYLAYFTYKRWKSTKSTTTNNAMPNEVKDYLTPNNISKYVRVEAVDDEGWLYVDAVNEDDILLDTIKSVIHSSLSCQNANQEWPYRLLKVYQSFSERLLRSALNQFRDQQLVSGKKVSTKHSGCKEGSILMRGTSYHLSFAYTFKQITKYPNYIYNEAHDLFYNVHNFHEVFSLTGRSVEKLDQGHGLGISEFALKRSLSFVFEMNEDDIITLNTDPNDCDDLIKELALRYHTLMLRKNQTEHDDAQRKPERASPKLEKAMGVFIKSQMSGGAREIQEDVEVELRSIFDDLAGNEEIESDKRQKVFRVSDLVLLLTKGLIPELDDDDRLEKLNRHFTVKYPNCKLKLEDERVNEKDALYEECQRELIRTADEELAILKKSSIVNNVAPKDDEIRKAFENSGGSEEEFLLSQKIAAFVSAGGIYGTSSKDLLGQFGYTVGNISVEQVLNVLIDLGVILRSGISNFAFVHFNYRHTWTIYLDSSKYPDVASDDVGYRVKISPWIRIDGSIHLNVLLNWLNIILSHCLSCPFIPFMALCKRFCYIKPVDIFYLLEFLEKLGCLKMYTYLNEQSEDLFHDCEVVEQVPTRILDDFNSVFIETDNMAIIRFGAFLNKDKTDFTVPFEE